MVLVKYFIRFNSEPLSSCVYQLNGLANLHYKFREGLEEKVDSTRVKPTL